MVPDPTFPTAEPKAAFTLQMHPPERRTRRQPDTLLCCGCCCCCCCLHSVGSLVGAAIGSIPAGAAHAPKPRAAGLYWLLMIAAVPLIVLGGGAVEHNLGILILALFLPAVQVGMALLAALLILVLPAYENKGGYLLSLGWITAGTVLGALLGIAVMWFLYR